MKKKILFIPGWYPDDLNRWNGDFIKSQTSLLREQKLQIDLCYADLNWRYFKKARFIHQKKLEIDAHGNKDFIVSGPYYFKNRRHGLNLWLNAYASHVEEMICRFGLPDIIHAHTYLGGAVALIVKSRYNIPFVITEHATGILSSSLSAHHLELANEAYHKANQVVSVSQELANTIERNYGVSSSVMPNFIDCKLFKLSEKKNKEFTFITVSDLIPRKRIDIAIRAFAQICGHIEAKLIIIGDGKSKESLFRLSEQLNLQNKINFQGVMRQKDLARVLANSHVLLHCSELETFGLVIIESMACGLPVICAENQGSRALIKDFNGVYISNITIDILAAAMIEIYENIDRYDPKLIRSYIKNSMSPKIAANKLKALYSESC